MDANPYAPPQACVVELIAAQLLPGWTVRRLRLLAGGCGVSVLGSMLLLVLTVLADSAVPEKLWSGANGLSALLIVLDSYLLLSLKAFAQARFNAQGLAQPVWLLLLAGLVLEVINLNLNGALFNALNWQTVSYVVLLLVYGVALLWFGLRVLRVPDVYPSLRLLAKLDIAGGLLLVSVVGVLLAVVPLWGSSMALAAVFWRAAREQKALAMGQAQG